MSMKELGKRAAKGDQTAVETLERKADAFLRRHKRMPDGRPFSEFDEEQEAIEERLSHLRRKLPRQPIHDFTIDSEDNVVAVVVNC